MGTADWGYTYLRTPTDHLWFNEGTKRGWTLGDPSPSWARFWGVRNVRTFFAFLLDQYDAYCWEQYGMYSTGYNDWRRYAIWRGWI